MTPASGGAAFGSSTGRCLVAIQRVLIDQPVPAQLHAFQGPRREKLAHPCRSDPQPSSRPRAGNPSPHGGSLMLALAKESSCYHLRVRKDMAMETHMSNDRTTGHSKLPWRLEQEGKSASIRCPSSFHDRIETCPDLNDPANAALIVLAVNSHAALVAALETARNGSGRGGCCAMSPVIGKAKCTCWRCKADRALKLATA